MSKVKQAEFYGFRFHAVFWRDYERTDRIKIEYDGAEVGFASIHHGPMGLEVWTAHRVGAPLLIDHLKGAVAAEIALLQSDVEAPSRVIVYRLTEKERRIPPRMLGVSINPKPMVVDLNASLSAIALDGVLFEQAMVVAVTHKNAEGLL